MDMEQWARVRRKVLMDGRSKRSVMEEEGLHSLLALVPDLRLHHVVAHPVVSRNPITAGIAEV